jgi:hypothetical protein
MSTPGDPAEREALIEAVAGAYREHDRYGVRPLAAWFDLDEHGRREAFDAAVQSRALEAALDPDGLSSTAHAVLARIPGAK